MTRALFLDRDGTINVDYGYVFRIRDFDFIPGIFDLCRTAVDRGYKIIVVTNQSGIARGYFDADDYLRLTEYMCDEFAYRGINITDVLHCPELSGPYRKPAPGMFLAAAQKHGIDMPASISVGDSQRDIDAAIAAGVGRNFLFDGDFTKIMGEL